MSSHHEWDFGSKANRINDPVKALNKLNKSSKKAGASVICKDLGRFMEKRGFPDIFDHQVIVRKGKQRKEVKL